MLSQLYIKNIAVIHEATIEFSKGFNVFTGETGAGKTMLISAINGVSGARLSKDIIRTGEESAEITALFTEIAPEIEEKIEAMGYSIPDGELLIVREIGARNVCKVNGRPATLQMLRDISALLVDIHGQKDNHRLLDPQYHMEYIDSFGDLDFQRSQYNRLYQQLVAVRKRIHSLEQSDREKEQRISLLQYQLNEISEASLVPGEEETLTARRDAIRNSEKIIHLAGESKALLDGDDENAGACGLLSQLAQTMGTLSRYVPELRSAADQVLDISYVISDIGGELGRQMDDMEFDPQALDEIEDRLELIHSLKRKYGSTIEEILGYGEKVSGELNEIQFSQERLDELMAEEETLLPQVAQLADQLTAARHQAAREFLSRIKEELEFLNMPSVKLTVSAGRTDYRPDGQDEMEFLISSNAGELPRPLSKIASGGELSRVMLSIKNVLAEKDQVATAVFDEIDTGISGAAAQKIGRKLQEVSRNRQVICVTHLAPVAACGDTHLFIHKEVENNRTYTKVDPLNGTDRVREIARIVSGEDITDTALKNAEEMIKLAHR